MQYPCPIVNRFQCPYQKDKVSKNANFDVEVSAVQIRKKQELYHALTDRETLYKILEQALDYLLSNRDTFEEKSKQNL